MDNTPAITISRYNALKRDIATLDEKVNNLSMEVETLKKQVKILVRALKK